jgi:hypothetical protein
MRSLIRTQLSRPVSILERSCAVEIVDAAAMMMLFKNSVMKLMLPNARSRSAQDFR